jgi:hypothetical protein
MLSSPCNVARCTETDTPWLSPFVCHRSAHPPVPLAAIGHYKSKTSMPWKPTHLCISMKTSRTFAVLFIALALSIYGTYRVWEINYFKNLIPSEIQINGTVLVDGETGGLEGCGVAIFRLDSATLEKIRANGIHALDEAKQSRKKKLLRDDYQTYTPWAETPYLETGDGMTLADRWLGGFVCSNIDTDLSNHIHSALKSTNSYYSTTHEAGLIVIPDLGLIVYSYFG